MPVNLKEIQRQIKDMGEQSHRLDELLKNKRMLAAELLKTYADQLDDVRARIEIVLESAPGIRCAIPGSESLTGHFACPVKGQAAALLAADGSQIIPNRHDAVEFGVINIGILSMYPGSGAPPVETTQTRLFYNDPTSQEEPLSEELVGLQRDLWERELLAQMAAGENPPLVALTDGPLELFREPKESKAFKRHFEKYLEALDRLGDHEVAAAGYVDRPQADLVISTLEMMLLEKGEISHASRSHPLLGVKDVTLYSALLEPGERSAVFQLQSISSRSYKQWRERLGLHFFYLNVGFPEHPYLVRIEIPGWVSGSEDLLNLLHTTLIKQCRMMGKRAYPYALLRAHEIALIKFEEKEQIENMIINELLRQGDGLPDKSNKQANKELSSFRMRYR